MGSSGEDRARDFRWRHRGHRVRLGGRVAEDARLRRCGTLVAVYVDEVRP